MAKGKKQEVLQQQFVDPQILLHITESQRKVSRKISVLVNMVIWYKIRFKSTTIFKPTSNIVTIYLYTVDLYSDNFHCILITLYIHIHIVCNYL